MNNYFCEGTNKPYEKRVTTLRNGLKATVSPLEDADKKFVRHHKEQLLNHFTQIFGKNTTIYVVAFHFNHPAYAVCLDFNFQPMVRRLLSSRPEEALRFCDATIINGTLQTHYFKKEHYKTLWIAVKNNVEPEIATLLRPFPDEDHW
jgi:hypothetical protein